MPAYELTIVTTKKLEKEWAEYLTIELYEAVLNELEDENGVDYDELHELKCAEAAKKILAKRVKELIPGILEDAVKAIAYDLNKNGRFSEFVVDNYIYDDIDDKRVAPLLNDVKTSILADKKYQNLVESVERQFTERKREELINRAKALRATVTFPEDE